MALSFKPFFGNYKQLLCTIVLLAIRMVLCFLRLQLPEPGFSLMPTSSSQSSPFPLLRTKTISKIISF